MRFLHCISLFILFILFAAPAAQAIPAPNAPAASTPRVASRANVVEQRYADRDGDGWCDNVVVTTGGKTWVQCLGRNDINTDADCSDTSPNVYPGAVEESATDGIDQNCDEADETEADGAKAQSLASWTKHSTVARGPNVPGYLEVLGQVNACFEIDKDWEFGTCNCGSGYTWRVFQDDAGATTGACDLIHGGNGIRAPGNGGVDTKARKAAEDASTKATDALTKAGQAVETANAAVGVANAANETANTATATATDALNKATGAANVAAGAATVANAANETANTATETANIAARNAQAAQDAGETHAATHVIYILDAVYDGGFQSLMKDSGVYLRGDGFGGFGTRFVFGARFAKYGVVGTFGQFAAVSEESEIDGERINVDGHDIGGGFMAGGNIPVTENVEVTLVALVGGQHSETGAAANQSQVVSNGPTLGGAAYVWYKNVGLTFGVDRFWETSGHSVVFESPNQVVTAQDLVSVPGDGTATTFRVGPVFRF